MFPYFELEDKKTSKSKSTKGIYKNLALIDSEQFYTFGKITVDFVHTNYCLKFNLNLKQAVIENHYVNRSIEDAFYVSYAFFLNN